MTKVEVERDEHGWWIATSPEVPGMATQARRLDQITDRAREAIAVMTDDLEPEDVMVDLDVHLDPDTRRAIDAYRECRHQAEEAQRRASAVARDAALRLVEQHLSLRDAGALLEISHQRVQQLVKS